MANRPLVPGREAKIDQSAFGGQGPLIIHTVPATASAALVGKTVVEGGALTVAGAYTCLIPIAGCVDTVQVHLNATFASGTVSSASDTLYWVQDPLTASSWTTKTSATGDGSLTTTVLQTATITGLKGEQYAQCVITLGSSTSATFTVAEWNGI